MSEKKEENKEPIKPMLIVPWVDREGRAVIETISREDAETLNVALDNLAGILVKGPEEGKPCPLDGKSYEKSICKKIDDLFKKGKKGKEKRETKKRRSKTRVQGCGCVDF